MSDRPDDGPFSARGRVPAHEAPDRRGAQRDDADRRLGGREAAPGEVAWSLEPHICRSCFARLLSRPAEADGWRLYQCTNCGLEASAQAASQVCCCGTKLRKATASGRSGAALIDAGIRCVPNPNPTPEFPSVIVACEMGFGDPK